MDTKLTQFYDDLKKNIDETPAMGGTLMKVGTTMSHPGATAYINKAQKERDRLCDDCCRHVILDIYCKILPLDHDHIEGHHGQMKNDIDCMLARKGMNGTQYITSCYEATKAPLLDFILRATDSIGREYMEDAKETLRDAQQNGIDIPSPEAPSTDDEKINSQIVDVTNDIEYDAFIAQLRKLTTDQIVDGISKVLADKKKEDDMKFKSGPAPVAESAVSISLDYLQTRLMKENVEIPAELQDDMIGMAIRESTMNQMDVIFKQPGSDLRSYKTRMFLGKGTIINESAASYFIESGNQRFEPLYKEMNGNKYDVSNYEKVDKDGKKTPMTDQEAKTVLSSEEYDGYKNKDKK